MRESQRLRRDDYLDGPAIARMRRTAAQRFKEQIEFGVPTAGACGPDTPALPKADNHHELVAAALEAALQQQGTFSGQLGALRSTRRQVYERPKRCRGAHQRVRTCSRSRFWTVCRPRSTRCCAIRSRTQRAPR
jgi:hypothetical protein